MFFNTSTVVTYKRRRVLLLVLVTLLAFLWLLYEVFSDQPPPPYTTFEEALLASLCDKVESHEAFCDELKLLPEVSAQEEDNAKRVSQLLLEEYSNTTETGLVAVFQQLFEYCNIITYDPNPQSVPLSLPDVDSQPTIFAITPTYKRLTQKVDLTSLCQTLMNVPDLIWIVVEDSEQKTDLVAALLKRCRVKSVHLHIHHKLSHQWPLGRGIVQRNYGLLWLRVYCSLVAKSRPCQGVVYFMDDDNKYDLRLFEEIRKTKRISVFPVAFVGGLKIEGPVCENEIITEWRVAWFPERLVPIDMAGFAINVSLIILHQPTVWMGYKGNKTHLLKGEMESSFLEFFVKDRSQLECRGSDTEVFVWHVKTRMPELEEEEHWKGKSPGDFLQY